jgi:hypothetical protein
MALLLLLGLVFACSIRAFIGWRTGIISMIVIAAVQDPLRKLVPGTPSLLVLATAPVFLAMVASSMVSTRRWLGDFARAYPIVTNWLLAFGLLCLPAATISLTYGAGSWMLTLFGVFSYSLIFLAIIAGFHYARSLVDVRRVLAIYCVVHGVMLSGGILEYMHWFPGWRILGDEALGYKWIRWEPGYIVEFISGFYRSGDVMGWHAAAVSTLSVVLGMTGPKSKRRYWLLLSTVAIFALLLCGRRKMVYMLPTFGLALGWVYVQAGRSSKVWAIVGLLALPAASVWVVADWLGEENTSIRYYKETSDQTLDSFQLHGFRSLYDTYDQKGFFGAGLGTATPGSHNLNVERPSTWQESGSSRVLVELGVPGALGFLAVMVSILLAMWKLTRRLLRARLTQGQYMTGLLAFFLANVGSLTVSAQILADPFIAAFLGFLVGLAMSFARPALYPQLSAPRRQEAQPAPGHQPDFAQELPH